MQISSAASRSAWTEQVRREGADGRASQHSGCSREGSGAPASGAIISRIGIVPDCCSGPCGTICRRAICSAGTSVRGRPCAGRATPRALQPPARHMRASVPATPCTPAGGRAAAGSGRSTRRPRVGGGGDRGARAQQQELQRQVRLAHSGGAGLKERMRQYSWLVSWPARRVWWGHGPVANASSPQRPLASVHLQLRPTPGCLRHSTVTCAPLKTPMPPQVAQLPVPRH